MQAEASDEVVVGAAAGDADVVGAAGNVEESAKRAVGDGNDGEEDEDDEDDEDDRRLVEQCCLCDTAAKYRCPCCDRRTCSLTCCQAHKAQFSCTGKRPRSEYAASKDQLTENVIRRDFGFLEDASRLCGMAAREQVHEPPRRQHLPVRTIKLLRAARQRQITLRIMAEGLSRHQGNTSFYHEKSQVIRWRVEWIFPHVEASFILDGLEDNIPVKDLLLREFCEVKKTNSSRRIRVEPYFRDGAVDKLRLLLRAEGVKSSGSPSFYEVDPLKSLQDNLAGKTVVEYPTLRVCMPHEVSKLEILPSPPVNAVTTPTAATASRQKAAPAASADSSSGDINSSGGGGSGGAGANGAAAAVEGAAVEGASAAVEESSAPAIPVPAS
eukprot:m.214460 g.214460  ORF g.214460 m.214460 type:complete len:382 (-) comp34757_c0_seq1:206-1351(-)